MLRWRCAVLAHYVQVQLQKDRLCSNLGTAFSPDDVPPWSERIKLAAWFQSKGFCISHVYADLITNEVPLGHGSWLHRGPHKEVNAIYVEHKLVTPSSEWESSHTPCLVWEGLARCRHLHLYIGFWPKQTEHKETHYVGVHQICHKLPYITSCKNELPVSADTFSLHALPPWHVDGACHAA